MIAGWSFHSVKGGVGKSTLSSRCAVALARRNINVPVYLLDLDLTGTSLADGLPLEAPNLGGGRDAPLDLRAVPAGFHSVDESRARVRSREDGWEPDARCGVPFLNDWLLHAEKGVGEATELALAAVSWRLAGGPPNLWVLPSSALPADLRETIPVVFDEVFSAFFESRLEYLLAAIAAESPQARVVIDVPPTIPGLSRAVLGVALRLARSSPLPLALDGLIPVPLGEGVRWRAGMVTTTDLPDVRAMDRWLRKIRLEEEDVIKVILNRALPGLAEGQKRARLDAIFGLSEPELGATPEDPLAFVPEEPAFDAETFFSPQLRRAVWIENDPALSVFDGGGILERHEAIERLLDALG